MVRLAIAIVSNIIILFVLLPQLSVYRSYLSEIKKNFAAAIVSSIALIVLLPVFRAELFSYRLAAIFLGFIPALLLLGSIWELFQLGH
ncbi:MAG: hypothetical protein SFY81_11850 [Verrucomicrobiota bacterium]|nr:hypothetical protein [Verrucomicrobiota bacterium]